VPILRLLLLVEVEGFARERLGVDELLLRDVGQRQVGQRNPSCPDVPIKNLTTFAATLRDF
jgi:hypothetical protein